MGTMVPVCAAVGRVISRHVHGGVLQFAMFSSARPVAVQMEEVGDRAMDGDEALVVPT